MLYQPQKVDSKELWKILLIFHKVRTHFEDYWLFYLLSSIGWVLGIFYFIYQYTHHQFTFLEHVEIFGHTVSLFQIINNFWIGLVVLALITSSFLYCKGQRALRKRSDLEKEIQTKREEMKHINEFYGKIIENVPVSIITLDKNGIINSVNPYFDELAGKSGFKNLGRSIFDLSFLKKSEELYKKYKNLFDYGQPFCYLNYPHIFSENPLQIKYLNLYVVPLKDKNGNVEGGISIAQDNTETFLALEESKAKARQLYLINQISKAINSSLNLQEVLWLILRNAVKLTNATSAAILLLENDNDLVVKDAYNMSPEWQKIRIKVGQGICGHAAFIRKPYFSNDVESDPYYISKPEKATVKSELAVPILSEGKVIGVIKMDSDESGRFTDNDVELMITLANNASIAIANSKLYEEVKNLNKTLEQKVIQRTEELKVANQKLEKAIELKSQFIADASHDLRTPLTVIKGNLDLALWDPKITQKEMRETLKLIDEEVKSMSGILADLMILTHAGAGKLHLNKSKINLDLVLKTAAQSMEVLAKEKNIKIDIKKLSDESVLIDESKFLKLLINLISNAIKYGKENGWVHLSAKNNGSETLISIADNGIGIPKNELPYIFERFYRVDKVRTREPAGGSGLGLAICKSIAEAHGGFIDVTSQLNMGSQFTVHLPINGNGLKNKY